jgi:uncharacterized protein YcbX
MASFPHTLASFRARHSEFTATPDVAVQAALDAAADEIDATVWGASAAEGHGLLAAHKLALSPFGVDMRLGAFGDNKARSVYGDQHEQLAARVGGAYRLVLE